MGTHTLTFGCRSCPASIDVHITVGDTMYASQPLLAYFGLARHGWQVDDHVEVYRPPLCPTCSRPDSAQLTLDVTPPSHDAVTSSEDVPAAPISEDIHA